MTGKGIVLFSFLLLVSDVVSVLINEPQNMAVINGARVSFNCSSSPDGWFDIFWRFLPVGESTQRTIANGGSVSPAYTDVYELSLVEKSTSTLIIKTVNESLAGTYTCHETGASTASAELIVYNSGPACTSNVSSGQDLTQGQSVQMSCSFSYAATNSSVSVNMAWSKSSSSPVENSSLVVTTSGTRTTAVSTFMPLVGYATPFPIYQCKTSFKVTGTTAKNDPGYSNTTQPYSSPINVLYFSPNCSITGANSGDDVYYGTRIFCKADANPPPSYRWSNGTDASLSNTDTVQITNDGQYTCTASNSVGRCTQSINLTTHSTQAPSTEDGLSETNKIIIGVVVGVGGFLLLLAIIIIICCCKKKNKSGAKYENGNTKPMNDYPPPYDGHVGPQRTARPDSVVYASADRQHPSQSSYVSNSPAHPHIADDGLNYAQIQLDNQPRSRQPLQMPEANSNYVEIALA